MMDDRFLIGENIVADATKRFEIRSVGQRMSFAELLL